MSDDEGTVSGLAASFSRCTRRASPRTRFALRSRATLRSQPWRLDLPWGFRSSATRRVSWDKSSAKCSSASRLRVKERIHADWARTSSWSSRFEWGFTSLPPTNPPQNHDLLHQNLNSLPFPAVERLGVRRRPQSSEATNHRGRWILELGREFTHYGLNLRLSCPSIPAGNRLAMSGPRSPFHRRIPA